MTYFYKLRLLLGLVLAVVLTGCAMVSFDRPKSYSQAITNNDNGDLEWHCTIENQEVIETKEPLTSRWLRFKAWFMKIAPESQL